MRAGRESQGQRVSSAAEDLLKGLVNSQSKLLLVKIHVCWIWSSTLPRRHRDAKEVVDEAPGGGL